MRLSALLLTIALPLVSHAALPSQPPRWVMTDDLRVRSGPSAEHKIIGTLPRGAELILKAPNEIDTYCLIEGEGTYGYVACKYLSAKPVARAKAGEAGIDAAQRWATGNALTLREEPRPDAAVIGRLALNAIVKLVREDKNGYCEVQPASGPNGYTACRYLAITPVVLARIQGNRREGEALAPEYDPERAFWLEPSWYALESYVMYLKARSPDTPPQGPWPRNDALERMKAHLALGLKGRKPEPFADWLELKRKAMQDWDLSREAHRLQQQGKKVDEAALKRDWQMQKAAGALDYALGIDGELHDTISNEGGAARIIRLIRALEFPDVQPSLFRSESELAPPRATTEEASGRFGIIFRQLLTPRPKPKTGTEEGSGAGLYDMLTRTQVLVRPIQRIQLFREGRLSTESSLMRKRETLWDGVDEPMCEGWVPGFAYGDADTSIWHTVDEEYKSMGIPSTGRQQSLKRNSAGSLFVFYTNINLPRTTANRTEISTKMDRDATGFVRGTSLLYDLDSDGIPDLAVWEGQGKGPGHCGGSTSTDDRWYRLALVNINGAWKVLGSDDFGYGCGC